MLAVGYRVEQADQAQVDAVIGEDDHIVDLQLVCESLEYDLRR